MSGYRLWPLTYFSSLGAQACARITRFNLTEDYQTGSHTWPGIDDRFDLAFGAHFSTYISVPTSGIYEFQLSSYSSISLYIDNNEAPLIYYDTTGGWAHVENGLVDLTSGFHLIEIQFNNVRSIAQVVVEMRPQGGQWILLDETNTWVAGLAPSWFTYDPISLITSLPLVIPRRDFSGSFVERFTITPPLPVGVEFDEQTGAITGSVEVIVS